MPQGVSVYGLIRCGTSPPLLPASWAPRRHALLDRLTIHLVFSIGDPCRRLPGTVVFGAAGDNRVPVTGGAGAWELSCWRLRGWRFSTR